MNLTRTSDLRPLTVSAIRMLRDALEYPPVQWTERELRRLRFARWLAETGRIAG